MNSTTAFNQIDHPLIILAQGAVAFSMFRLFYLVRERPWPMPQIVALLAFSVLINMAGRVTKASWFVYADIAQYCIWGVLTTIWAVSVSRMKLAKQIGTTDEHGKAAILSSDIFDRYETQASWSFGILIGGMVIYAFVNLNTEKLEAKIDAATAYVRGYTKAVSEQGKREQEAKAGRDSIAAALREKDVKDSLWREFIKADRKAQLAAINGVKNAVASKKPSKSQLSRPSFYVAPARPHTPSVIPDYTNYVKPLSPPNGKKSKRDKVSLNDTDEDIPQSDTTTIYARKN